MAKQILKKAVFFISDRVTDLLMLLVRLNYVLFGKEEDVQNPPRDCFDSMRVKEKEQFERILDRPNRQLKPAYIQLRNCPNCEGESHRPFFLTQDLFDYVQCNACGFTYALQMLTHQARVQIYGGLTGKDAVQICCSTAGRSADHQRFALPLKLIQRHCKGGRLIDVGCGVGNFLNQAREAGFMVEGIETHEEFRQAAKEHYGIDVRTGIFEELNLQANSYQVVTMWETLEHIYNPKSAVRAAFQILSDQGILAISVPNLQNFGFLLLREFSAHRGGEHINFFSPETLAQMVIDSGFEILESHTTDNSDWPAVLNLLNLDLGRLYCYDNVGNLGGATKTRSHFFLEAEALFFKRFLFPILSRYERRTGRGSGITLLARKPVQQNSEPK